MTLETGLERVKAGNGVSARFSNIFDFVDFAGLFEDGISYPRMSEFMYGNYHLWEAVARGPGYRAMHDALEEVDVSIVQAAAKEIGKRGIRQALHQIRYTLDREALARIAALVRTGQFRNKSHVMEFAVMKLVEIG